MKIKGLIIFLVITSCNPTKSIRLKDEGDINDAVINSIIDFSKSGQPYHKYYYVMKEENSKDVYRFTYVPDYTYDIKKEDIIGSKSRHFPSSFKEINGTLYFWDDSTKVISKKIFNKLTNLQLIDSTMYKVNEGILPENTLIYVTTDESKKYTMYYVCKDKINKFLKVTSNVAPRPSNYPQVNCSD